MNYSKILLVHIRVNSWFQPENYIALFYGFADYYTMNVYLKKGKEKALLLRHHWIFSGAIESIDDGARDGDVVAIHDRGGIVLGYGYLNRASQITVRMLSFGDAPFTANSLKELLSAAIARRKANPLLSGTDAFRLIHSEGDFLPGLIVDSYAGHLVIQALTLGIDRMKGDIIRFLGELLDPPGIYERSDHRGREMEGLTKLSGLLSGSVPEEIIINENGLRFIVDIAHGQKTGFFLDQREHRGLVRRVASGRKALNLFSYTGGFTAAALAGGALSVTSVDSSAGALAMLEKNVALNGPAGASRSVRADVFDYLREGGPRFGFHHPGPACLRKKPRCRPPGPAGIQGHQPPGDEKMPPGVFTAHLLLLAVYLHG